MKKSLREIYFKFNGKLVGNNLMKKYVCETVARLPVKIQSFITKTCWFFSSMDDAWAFTFTGNDLKNQHMIFLSDELWEQDDEDISHTIIHEVGHVMLGHRNSTLVRQSKKEIHLQEKEANAFAKQYERV